jgi:mannosyltransferase
MPLAMNLELPEVAANHTRNPSALPSTPSAGATKNTSQIWNTVLPLLLISAIGLSLRLHTLGTRSLWLDEGVSAAITRLSWSDFRTLLEWREGNMALYYLLLKLWATFGYSEFHLRSLSVLFGMLTIPAIYLLGRELYGRSAGLLAALFLALHPFHVHYSQEARSYALLGFVLVLSAYYMVRALRSNSDANCMAFVELAAASVYVHFFAILCIGALFAAAPLVSGRMLHMRRATGSLALLGLLVLPGMNYAWEHRSIGLIDWIPAPTWVLVGRCLSGLFGTQGLLGLAYASIVIPLLFFGRSSTAHRAGFRLVALPILWAFLPGLVLLVTSFQKPILIDRYLLMSVPGTVLLASFAADRSAKLWRAVVVTSLILISLVSLQLSFKVFAAESEDWRGAVNYAIHNSQPNDVVLLDNGIVHPILDYYLRQAGSSSPRVNSFGPRSEQLTYNDFAGIMPPDVVGRAATLHDRVWLFEWAPKNPLIPELERNFTAHHTQEFSHLKVSLYSRPSVATAQ